MDLSPGARSKSDILSRSSSSSSTSRISDVRVLWIGKAGEQERLWEIRRRRPTSRSRVLLASRTHGPSRPEAEAGTRTYSRRERRRTAPAGGPEDELVNGTCRRVVVVRLPSVCAREDDLVQPRPGRASKNLAPRDLSRGCYAITLLVATRALRRRVGPGDARLWRARNRLRAYASAVARSCSYYVHRCRLSVTKCWASHCGYAKSGTMAGRPRREAYLQRTHARFSFYWLVRLDGALFIDGCGAFPSWVMSATSCSCPRQLLATHPAPCTA